jgi:hypothetical protein
LPWADICGNTARRICCAIEELPACHAPAVRHAIQSLKPRSSHAQATIKPR